MLARRRLVASRKRERGNYDRAHSVSNSDSALWIVLFDAGVCEVGHGDESSGGNAETRVPNALSGQSLQNRYHTSEPSTASAWSICGKGVPHVGNGKPGDEGAKKWAQNEISVWFCLLFHSACWLNWFSVWSDCTPGENSIVLDGISIGKKTRKGNDEEESSILRKWRQYTDRINSRIMDGSLNLPWDWAASVDKMSVLLKSILTIRAILNVKYSVERLFCQAVHTQLCLLHNI